MNLKELTYFERNWKVNFKGQPESTFKTKGKQASGFSVRWPNLNHNISCPPVGVKRSDFWFFVLVYVKSDTPTQGMGWDPN